MTSGSLALLLHAHLPYVRHAQPVDEERWLFEAITESYVPLVRALERLTATGFSARFTCSFSPTLCAMLEDELLRARYRQYLAERIELAEISSGQHSQLAEFYREFFCRVRELFIDEWQCDLLAPIRRLRERGTIELIASAATHALLSLDHETARVQIALGLDAFRETFGGEPAGFWLPECAYVPGLEKLLAAQNIRWFGVEGHALERATPRARRGPFAPIFTPSGPAAFAREPNASRQIWDAHHGYPGDAAYRDFHSDLGFEAGEFLPANERGKFTGLKFRRVTGRKVEKEFYDPLLAIETALGHAAHFVEQQIARLDSVEASGCESIIFAPFDAELFGHWWFEGPIFLEALVRQAMGRGLTLTTPTEFLARNPTQQVAQPAASSWGDGGFLEVWLDEKCAWLYPPLQAAREKMSELAQHFRENASPIEANALRELGREFLLAQASDWPFLIRNGTARDYATRRIREHLARFHQLAGELEEQSAAVNLQRQRTGETGESAGEAKAASQKIAVAGKTDYPSLFPALNWRTFLAP